MYRSLLRCNNLVHLFSPRDSARLRCTSVSLQPAPWAARQQGRHTPSCRNHAWPQCTPLRPHSAVVRHCPRRSNGQSNSRRRSNQLTTAAKTAYLDVRQTKGNLHIEDRTRVLTLWLPQSIASASASAAARAARAAASAALGEGRPRLSSIASAGASPSA